MEYGALGMLGAGTGDLAKLSCDRRGFRAPAQMLPGGDRVGWAVPDGLFGLT